MLRHRLARYFVVHSNWNCTGCDAYRCRGKELATISIPFLFSQVKVISMRPFFKPVLVAAAVGVFSHSSVWGLDSASAEFATGNHTKMLRAGAQWNWASQWWSSNGTHVGGYWDATLALWQGNHYQGVSGNTQNLMDIGITPVFRLQNDNKLGFYGEAGVGLHLLSEIYDNNGRHFSSNFQFGDHIGFGYVLKNGWDLGFKIQHYSNGGVKHPNPGVNYAVLKAGYTF